MVDRGGRHRNRLPSNLPQLQNLIKRDPVAYREEVSRTGRVVPWPCAHLVCIVQFMQQYRHYQSLRELLLYSPAQDSPRLSEIVMFIGQVCLRVLSPTCRNHLVCPLSLGHYNEITCFSSLEAQRKHAGGRLLSLFIITRGAESF